MSKSTLSFTLCIIIHRWINIINYWVTIIITSTSDLQPSTAILNQLPDQSVSTQIRTIGIKLF